MIKKELLEKCIKKESKACKELYFQLFNTLMGISMRYQKNELEAKAVVNNVFLKILHNLEKIDIDKSIEPWAKKICVHENIDKYRRNKKYQETIHFPDLEMNYNGINTTFMDADDLLNYQDLLDMIRELPEIEGQVFNLFVIDGYKHQEIAKIIGFTEGTSKWYLSKARKTLQNKIEEEVERQKNIMYERK